MKINTLNDLYIDELRDLFDAENQLVKALPTMAKAASNAELKNGIEEHLEQTREHLRGYPLTGIPHADDQVSSLSSRRDRDATSLLHVFAGIRQEVTEDLFQPHRVAFDHHRLGGHGDAQLVPPLLGQCSNGFDRPEDDRGQIEGVHAEVNLPFGESGDVKQVLD